MRPRMREGDTRFQPETVDRHRRQLRRNGQVRQDRDAPRRTFSLLRWGLIPYWAKDLSIAAKTINAMSETAAEKPAFRDAISRRRCLIPARRLL